MKKLIGLLIAISIIFLAGLLLDLRDDRSKTIKILKSTPLFDGWESINSSPIGGVKPGEKLKVLRIRYAKDHMAVKVEKEDGSIGWIIPDTSVEIGRK
jgi:hypothetical protein